MILTFSQGIVTHSTVSGLPGDTPNFLVTAATNTKVNLHAPLDQPFQLAITHRDANYLLTVQSASDVQAWGYGNVSNNNAPFALGAGSGPNLDEFYLYVELDLATGLTSYGWTKYQPTEGSTPPYSLNPANRPNSQHWFNTVENAMFTWQASGIPPAYGRFTEKVRCFVAKYTFGSGFTSMSINSPSFIGTTVGLPISSYRAGALIFDVNGNVLKRTDTNNKTVFFTTEDIFASGLPTSSRTRLESFVIDGIAQSPIAAYQAVYFSDLNELLPLTPYVQNNVIFGIIEQEAGAAGDLVKVTTDGVINNASWNWQNVNQQIYVDKDAPGALTSVEDGYAPLPNQKPVAIAIDKTTILVRASELLLSTGGLDTFVELLDTPTGYTTDSERIVKVNASETGLEFGAELSHLDDVDVLTPSPGHILYYGSTLPNMWESAAPGSASGVQAWDITLDQLAAVTPTTGNVLVYEGSPPAWTTRDLVEADISDLQAYLLPSDIGVTVQGYDADLAALAGLATTGILVRTGAGTAATRTLTTTTTNAITFTNPNGVSGGNIQIDAGPNLEDIAALSAATDQFVVGQAGNFVARTPAQVKTILNVALSELADVNFTGSPATPVTGDVLTYTGTEWQALPPSGGGGGGGLPTSVTECNILVADNAGGWNEQAIPDLPVPYDMSAQVFGDAPTSSIVLKIKMPRTVVVLDYGHQMDAEAVPGVGSPADSTFTVTKNGTDVIANAIGTFTFDDTSGNGHFEFSSTFNTFVTGDVLYIISPPGDNTGLTDVGLTLRALVEPAVPCGALSVSFNKTLYTQDTDVEFPSGDVFTGATVSGSFTHLEWAVTHLSGDNITYYPLDDVNGHEYSNAAGVSFDFGGGPDDLDSESLYLITTNTQPEIAEITFSGIYYRIRLTAYGPAGIATATTILKFVGF